LQIESDLKRANFQRDEVENQLTAVTLEKDVLQDEVGHVRKEMENLRDHLTKVCDENVKLTKSRSELEYRREQTEKELLQLEEKMKFLRSEKSSQAAMIDEIQLEFGNCY
jgi:chromosome segregation ATPase